MNERIRELAEQAGLEFDDDESLEFGKQIYYVTKEDMEKFAELIVRECVRHFNEDYQRDFDTLWREDLSKSIKEHFGVEE